MLRKITRLSRAGDVEGLMEALRRGSRLTRTLAADELRNFEGADVEEALLTALSDRSIMVRRTAAESLAQVNPDVTPAAVIAAVRGGAVDNGPLKPREILDHCLWSLPSIDATSTLLHALETASELDRSLSLHVLGETGDMRVFPAIVRSLDDPHAGVRIAAVQALGELRDPRAVDELARKAEDTDLDVRREAIKALKALGDSAQSALQDIAATSSSRRSRRWARQALKART